MKLIYTTRRVGPRAGTGYRNPRYFTSVERGATHVTVEGDFPHIVAAYQAIGVPVGDRVEGVPVDDGEAADPVAGTDTSGGAEGGAGLNEAGDQSQNVGTESAEGGAGGDPQTSQNQPSEEDQLRAAYQEKFGRPAHPATKLETLREKLAEA